MQNNPVGWFEIYVQDMARAQKFYEAILGVKLEQLPMPEGPGFGDMQMLAFPMEMQKPGAAGALVKMKDGISGPGGSLIYFNCDDCAVEEARVKDNGGSVCQSKMSIGQYGFIAVITDTEGNVVGLHSQK